MPAAELLSPLVSAASGLIGVLLGGWLTSWDQRKERRHKFILGQLTEFYAPMLGMRERLRTKGEIRLKVSTAAKSAWRAEDLSEREKLSPQYDKIITEHNQQLIEELPVFKQMVDLFAAKMHLSEASTRTHFPALVEFVELWERYLRECLPGAVVEHLDGLDETRLMPFYADLKTQFERLQAILKT